MSRADATLGMRLCRADKEALRARAKAANLSVAAYVRKCALDSERRVADDKPPDGPAGVAETAAAVETPVETHHIDDLGPDTLRLDTGALTR